MKVGLGGDPSFAPLFWSHSGSQVIPRGKLQDRIKVELAGGIAVRIAVGKDTNFGLQVRHGGRGSGRGQKLCQGSKYDCQERRVSGECRMTKLSEPIRPFSFSEEALPNRP